MAKLTAKTRYVMTHFSKQSFHLFLAFEVLQKVWISDIEFSKESSLNKILLTLS